MAKPAPPDDPIELHLCHRCLMRLPVDAGGVDLPRRVRQALQAHGLADRTQLIPASCLGHCPTDKVTVLVVPDATARGTHAKLIDPREDGEDLARHLEEKLPRARKAGPP
jgi:hypothetical protein